jgi:hypothetical protein
MPANTSVATGVGSTFSVVATAPATYDSAGYAALTWVPVGEVTDLPEFGQSRGSVSFTSLNGRMQKFAGNVDMGKLTLGFGLNTDDAGQIVLKTGVSSSSAISIKVVTQNGDAYYFRAIVLSFKVNVGSSDKITTGSCELDITTTSAGVGIVEVLAA